MMQEVFVGVDVAKNWLDIHHPRLGARRIDNTPAAARTFAAACARNGAWVVFEASGGYDRLLREAAGGGGCPVRSREPAPGPRLRPRDGCDRQDGQGRCAHAFGTRLPASSSPYRALPLARRALQAQATRRRQLVELHKQEATRLQQTADDRARADIRSLVVVLDRRIAKALARMAELIAADPGLAEIDRRQRTVQGVGAIVAATLITELPELGRLDRRRIAARARLAPIARDSGKRVGRRSIGGGRPVVRTMLDIAALHASRRCPTFQSFRARLQQTGKPAKVAITATARKLLGILNAMAAARADYRLAAPG